MDISKIKCFLLDLDGTVYLEGELIGDMKNTLKKIRESGRKIVYLTNNSSKNSSEYVEKLKKIGIFEEQDIMYSSGDATITYIKNTYPDKSIYLVGTKALCREFEENGIKLDVNSDVLVVCYDTELTYEKMVNVAGLLNKGATYIVTHPDINCPAKAFPLPDVGSFISLFETSTGRKPDLIIGKPNTVMGDGIKQITGFNADQIIMVGDRLYTDIKFGVNNKFSSLLVFSGETTHEDYKNSDVKATYTLESLNDIVKFL